MINKTMSFVLPSPVTVVKSYEKKCRNYFFKIITTTTLAYYKTRNTGTRNNGTQTNGGTAEHPGTVAEQWNTLEHRRNTLKYQQNTNVTPTDHPGTTEPYKTKNNCSDFKENLNFTLIHLTLSTQGDNIFYY